MALKAIVVGCGGMANGWVGNAINTPGLKLVGLVDIRREAAEAMADRHKLPRAIVFDSLKQAVEATQADIVFDVTIPAAHDKVVCEALKLGCHVLGEKPMSDTLAKARKMVRTSEQTGRVYAVTQNYRYNPQIRGLHRFLRAGKIGSVEEVHADFYLNPRFGGFRDEMAHPLLLDMAIHTFDAARFLADADPVAVTCHSWNPKRSWYKGDASACAIFEMAGGLVFTYRGSWCADGLVTPWNSHWRIIGQQGTVGWDGADDLRAEVVKKSTLKQRRPEFKPVNVPTRSMAHVGHAALMREFVRAIDKGQTPETLCSDNIKSLAMVLAAVKSADSGGKRVKVAW